ncbi:MAG: LysR family transcriptional regulator [Clostridium sp.]|nr:LysR family transcriptional regulator [Clostridium sp.]MDY5894982.1 LysR family transcriptional regulator [Oscillospiraceae bacterium]
MNLMHIKYAVEVANEGSINKAAEKLYVGQPNLSRAIKELEASLGVKIFERSAKGMGLTSDGETFIRYAKTILRQVDEVESIFNGSGSVKKRFSISVPRASYISDAFARFSHSLTNEAEAEIIYKETNSLRAIKNILHEDYKLGIIRYAENYDKYFKTMLDEKDMQYEMITEFSCVLAMSRDNPLASAEKITFDALKDYIEIAHADPYVPSLPLSQVRKEELPDNIGRRIFVFERASQFELLSENPETFMWVSPIPQKLLDRYDLVQIPCEENKKIYKDILIYKRDYKLTALDKAFIDELCKSKREMF